MKKQITLFLDYKKRFLYKSSGTDAAMDNGLLADSFSKLGWELKFERFSEINFRDRNYENDFVLYCSSEDQGLRYKDYIEDMLLGLEMQGAILIPPFRYFRAHMNKVFGEVIRDTMNLPLMNGIKSQYFGTYEEYAERSKSYADQYTVLKVPDGACGHGVHLCRSKRERDRVVAAISATPHSIPVRFKNRVKRLMKLKRHPYIFESSHRRKYILQNFLPDLKDDWKVLVYNERFYVLNRRVRRDDFRASGSHDFDFAVDPPEGLLDYAQRLYEHFDVPYASFDICVDRGNHYLIEFQFLSFGTTTIEKASRHFFCQNGAWQKTAGRSTVEEETARSVVEWIGRKYGEGSASPAAMSLSDDG